MGSWHSYGKVFNLGHRCVADIFDGNVLVEEKIDGSQFSFGVFDGEIRLRSRNKEMTVDTCESLFENGKNTVVELLPLLHNGWTYRGEYLQKPHHNGLVYDRIPNKHIIIFDIAVDEEKYLGYEDKLVEANRIGLECVPKLDYDVGKKFTLDALDKLLETDSVLGGQKIEGVVIKNYDKVTDVEFKTMMAKFVSEKYKEVQSESWKKEHPGGKDIIIRLGEKYKTEARWEKSVQHLRERGELFGEPKDIGNLMKEVCQDILDECGEDIKNELMKWAWKSIGRLVVGGLPEWYKRKLVEDGYINE
jgi:hypothetical protein